MNILNWIFPFAFISHIHILNLCKVFDKREITLLMCVLRCTGNEFEYIWCCDIVMNFFLEWWFIVDNLVSYKYKEKYVEISVNKKKSRVFTIENSFISSMLQKYKKEMDHADKPPHNRQHVSYLEEEDVMEHPTTSGKAGSTTRRCYTHCSNGANAYTLACGKHVLAILLIKKNNNSK